MSLLQGTHNYTVTVVIMATSFFSAIFFFILFAISKAKGILMIFMSNVMQVAITVCFLILAATTNKWAIVAANSFSVLLAIFWINSIFIIFNIKKFNWMLIAIASLGVFQAIILYASLNDIHAVNVSSSFMVAAVAYYGAIKASYQETADKNSQKNYSVLIMFVFGALNIIRGLFRLFNPLTFGDFNSIDKSAAIFILICYGFSFLVNYSILYLNFDKLVRKAEKLSYIDKLTGALSRNTFFVILSQKLAEIKRCRHGICVALLDIDNFKQINDAYGHLAGDKVLKCFVQAIKENMRANDVVGRFGGEEFMLIIEARSCNDALSALSRLRSKMNGEILIAGEKITFSCGHMYIDNDNCDIPIDNIVEEIDFKMYEAKALGKDRIV